MRCFALPVVLACWALLTTATSLLARDNALSQAEVQQGWILLFDGESLYGWSAQGAAQWHVDGGKLVAETGDAGSLRTDTSFADFDLVCDFLTKTDGKSGVFLRTDKDGDPEAGGYKLQIDDKDSKFPTGSLVGQIKASAVTVAPNQWHTYAVQAVGDHFVVKLDGQAILGGDGHKNKVGRIGLQFVPGTPVQFRNVKLRPLGLGDIFNGKTLYQWSEVGAQAGPKKKGALKKLIPVGGGGHPSEWSVEDGAIHVKKGPSELESGAAYDDFVLQIDVQADAHKSKQHPSGGIFIRADKAAAGTGYKVQIHNEYQGNASQPVGPGTGGLTFVHARRIVSADDQFFKLTVAASGHHISTWINGYQTANYEDTRADGPDALIQARTLPGPIRLAADDAASSLDFRNIAVVTLPKSNPPLMAAQAPPSATTAAQPPAPPAPAVAPPVMALPGAPAAPAANPHQKEIDGLLQQAVATSDPAQQVKLYDRILTLEPGNQVAYSRRADAQAKLQSAQAEAAQAERQRADAEKAQQLQQEQASTNEATKEQEIDLATKAIVAGNLAGAAAHVAAAKKVAPTDPKVLELEAIVQSRQKTQWRERWLAFALGGVGLLAIISLVWASIGKRQAFLEIVEGVDAGKRFSLGDGVTHIGAVAQDGGKKNEIVIKDLDRSISRFHCEVHRQNGKFWVLDCNSSNGTFVNGHGVRPDKPVLLKKSSRLQLAEACTLRLRYAKAQAKES